MAKEKMSLIADTVHGTVRISKIEKEIISSSIFNRLHDISQNSTAYLTFPSNRTKRFEHSIGTMFLAGQMFYYSIMNAEKKVCEVFLKELDDTIKLRVDTILEKEDDKYKAELHDANYKKSVLNLFSSSDEKNVKYFLDGINIVDEWIPHNIKDNQKFMFLVLMQSVRLAGLMHDVGHPPFSHITESAMCDVWKNTQKVSEEKRSEEQKQYYNALERYFKDGGELHEKIGNQITERLLKSILKPMPRERNAHKKYLPSQLFNVMVKEMTSAILDEKTPLFKSIHSIISGSFDADRLDYVTRDMENSGLDIGKVEYDRLIPQMKLIIDTKIDPKTKYYFCPSIKSVNVLEDFFNRRWNLYRKIIFHHRVIKTDFLLKECIVCLLNNSINKISLIDKDQKVLPYDITGLWKAVEKNPSLDVFFNRLIQWNDGWLMVILKKAFLQMEDNDDDILKDKFKELLAGEKHYYSIVKSAETFREIDQKSILAIKNKLTEIKECLIEISSMSEQINKKNEILKIKPFCDDLSAMIRLIENYSDKTFREKGFILGRISRLIFGNYYEEGTFQNIVSESVEQIKNESHIYDIIVVFKEIKTGIEESLMLFNRDDELIPFKNISNTEVDLKIQQEYVLPFFIYINTDKIDSIDYKEIRNKIGEKIGENVVVQLIDLMKTKLRLKF